MRYRVDDSVQVLGDGRQIMGGSPLRIFKLTEGGVRMFARLRNGDDLPRNVLIDRFTDGGAIHPLPSAGEGPFTVDDVTIVVPAFVPVGEAIVIADLGPRMIVVDDASTGSAPVAPAHAQVIRRTINGGPGAARMTGLAEVTTPLVAFVDDDVQVPTGWLDGLLAHFVDPRVAMVAPRVDVVRGSGALFEFDKDRSPLDLGPSPARVRARTRVSYVPTAAIVVRVDALRAVGGFDADLRTGEDVDMAWRLDDAGYIVRYEPSVVVRHEVRPDLRSWLAQRRSYGRSAGPLAKRHPGALAPLGISGWSASIWALIALGQPLVAGGVAGWTAKALFKKLPDLPRKNAIDLIRFGHLGAGRQIASAVTRAWWPIALVAALVSRKARRAVVAAVLLPALSDWYRKRPAVDPVRYVGLRVLDDAAYGLGVWEGALQSRTVEPLRPDFTSWPRPSRFEKRQRRPQASEA
jgi:mycofactocin glycosyltransferase